MQFIQIVVIIYILYYAGNIIYDIFLKKEPQRLDEENTEEFSFGLGEESRVQNIQMDDVEEMTTTAKFEADENEIFGSENSDDNEVDWEALEEKYNQEMALENSDNRTAVVIQKYSENNPQSEEEKQSSIENDAESNEKQPAENQHTENATNEDNQGGRDFEKMRQRKELILRNKQYFKEIMMNSETKVQTVLNVEGEKIYKI